MKTEEVCTYPKIFVNVCLANMVDEPSLKANQWSVPYAMNTPRFELDNKNNSILTIDIIVNNSVPDECNKDIRKKAIVQSVAVEAVYKYLQKIKHKKVKYHEKVMKKIKCFGTEPALLYLEGKAKDQANKGSNLKENIKPVQDKKLEAPEKKIITPKYEIIYQKNFDMSDHLEHQDKVQAPERISKILFKIKLPFVNDINDIKLDVTEDNINLTVDFIDKKAIFCKKNKRKKIYKLQKALALAVEPENSKATFCKKTFVLTLILKIKSKKTNSVSRKLSKLDLKGP